MPKSNQHQTKLLLEGYVFFFSLFLDLVLTNRSFEFSNDSTQAHK